jgi:uncharacterized protein
MKVTGSAILSAPRDRVWAALNDPAVLVRTIPGCQRLEAVGPDDYRMTVSAGVASIKGVYDGEVRLSDQRPPEAFVLKARGAGGPGTVDATARVTLTEDGDQTQVSYNADAIVGGMVAGVGQRMLTAVAKRTAGEFFANVDDVLGGRAPGGVTEELPAGVAAAGQPVTTQTPSAGVYVAPPKARQLASPALILGSAVVGAIIALVGVWVGWALAS